MFAAGLALRLIYLYQYSRSPFWDLLFLDTESHQRMAERILNGLGLGSRAYFRSPAYFYLLAALEYIGNRSLWPPRIFQSVTGSLTAVLAALFAFRLTGKRWAAALAGLIVAGFWLSIYFDGELLIENSSCFINLLAVYLLTRNGEPASARFLHSSITAKDEKASAGRRETGNVNTALSGLVMGIAAIFRPNFLLFALGIFLIWLLRGKWRQALVLGIFIALPVLPITVRNLVVAKDPVLIASQDGINFWIGNGPSADGRTVILPYSRSQLDGDFLAAMKDDPWFREDVWLVALYAAEKNRGRKLKDGEVSRYWMQTTLREMSRSPARSLKLLLKKSCFLVSSTVVSNNRDLNYHRDQIPLLSALGWLHLGIIWPAALLGMLLGLADKKNRCLILYVILYGASVVLFFVTTRYEAPLFPALAIFAAAGLARLGEIFRGGKIAAAAGALILLAGFAWLSNSEAVKWNDRPLAAAMRYNLGVAMIAKGGYQESLEPLRAALEIKPDYAEAHLALANALALAGKPEESIKHYREALFYQPGFAEAHYNFGLTLLKLNRPEQAYDQFQNAHNLKPALFPTPEQALETLSR